MTTVNPVVNHEVDEEYVEETGLKMMFVEERIGRAKASTNRQRFYDKFGCFSATASTIYNDLQRESFIGFSETELQWFLRALWYMRHYPKETEFESPPQDFSKKYASKKVWEMIHNIRELKHIKIHFPTIFHHNEVWIMTVDGTDQWTVERRTADFSQDRKRFSKKFDHAGMAYELGISLTGGLIWMNGPFLAGTTDLNKFRFEGGLKERLQLINKKAIADLGYPGEHECISTLNPHDYDAVRKFKSRALKRHETFNGIVKAFAITHSRFRHSDSAFAESFEATCVVAQYKVENELALFDVLVQDVIDRE